MTLPRKGSRTVNVDGVVYRWKPSPMRGYEPPMIALITHEDTTPSNSTLEVQTWERHCSILTPDIVASFIRGAIDRGWDPKSKGTMRIGPDEAANMFPKNYFTPNEQNLARRTRAGLG